MWYVITEGLGTLRQAILGGQYKHPKGIYFGGFKKEKSTTIFQNLLDKHKKNYDTFFHLDLHTGYGEQGKLHFFSNTRVSEAHKAMADEMFAGFPIDRGEDKDFYRTSGDITEFSTRYLEHAGKKIFPMTFEFGTQDSQTLKGSFFSLRSLIAENQGFHFHSDSKVDLVNIQQDFQSLFNPKDSHWRQKVLQQAHTSLDILFYRFGQFPK